MRVQRKNLCSVKPIYVIWQDAVSEDAWMDETDDVPCLHTIHTLGWLFYEDREMITIVQNLDIERNGRSMEISIPKKWILKRHE